MAITPNELLEYVNRSGYEPMRPKTLAKKLGVSKKAQEAFLDLVHDLVAAGKLRKGGNGAIHSADRKKLLVGILRRTASGPGYVILHEPKPKDIQADVFIDPGGIGDAQTGDEVQVTLTNRVKSGGNPIGRIVDILERATNTFVGSYFDENGQGYVQIDGTNFVDPVWVGDAGAKGAQTDDKVVVEMVRFPTNYAAGEAVITKVLGKSGAPEVDTLTVIHEYGLPHEFPEEVLANAREQAEAFDENDLADRFDLTDEIIITIDPKEARDFDDAISLHREENGHWNLGVHIADVAHFVPPKSALDEEAKKRGTSVYLPTRVIPMLPEIISNALASLQEGKVRFVKSVFVEFDPDGVPVNTRFARSAIKVKRRFTYEQIMDILKAPEQHRKKLPDEIFQLIMWMQELARMLRRRRFERGSMELHMPDIELEFDRDGRVSGAHHSVDDESHQIIEEFMLMANVAVATELTDQGILFLRRNHDDPRVEKMIAFKEFVTSLGFEMKNAQSREEIQALLNAVKDEPLQYAVHYAFLRSLKQAQYSAEEIGHYALAVQNYCHFTSPIRRYPDLTIHRILDDIFDGRKVRGMSDEQLAKLGFHCTTTEKRAERAERELTKLKLLQYMENRLDDELQAVVTGVERFGLFCQCMDVPAEGLVHISHLSRTDHFDYDRESWSLTGRRSGKVIRLGDRVKVRVVHVDVERRELDMDLIAVLRTRPSSKPAKKKSNKSRKSNSKQKPRKSTSVRKKSRKGKPKR